MQKFLCYALGTLCLLQEAQAFTQISISTAAPAGIEQKFLAATTNQFNATIIANPLAANTYSLKLFGPNPNYQAPPPPPSTLEQALSLGSTVYVYGFADGMVYQTTHEEGLVGSFGNLCSSATSFILIDSSTSTFDLNTCQDVITTIENALFDESLSTPTLPLGR